MTNTLVNFKNQFAPQMIGEKAGMRRYYAGITIFKLGGSLLVLLSHGVISHYIEEMANQQLRFLITILSFIVPCFYVIAGFLAYKGWTHAKESRLYIQRYLKWILLIYGFFCLIFAAGTILPELIKNGLSFSNLFLQSKILLMTIVLYGPFVQFWFIPPLIFGIIVTYWLYEKKWLRLGLGLTMLCFIASQLISGTLRGVFDYAAGGSTFLETRYMDYIGLFVTRYLGFGLTFVLTGVLLARHEDKFLLFKGRTFFILALVVSSFEAFFLYQFVSWKDSYSLAFSIFPNTIFLFYGVLHIKSQLIRTYHRQINLFSMITFFSHTVFLRINFLVLHWSWSNVSFFHLLSNFSITLLECFLLTFCVYRWQNSSASRKERLASS
jgi:hypothetical protein